MRDYDAVERGRERRRNYAKAYRKRRHYKVSKKKIERLEEAIIERYS
jgi:hypothetical protein